MVYFFSNVKSHKAEKTKHVRKNNLKEIILLTCANEKKLMPEKGKWFDKMTEEERERERPRLQGLRRERTIRKKIGKES